MPSDSKRRGETRRLFVDLGSLLFCTQHHRYVFRYIVLVASPQPPTPLNYPLLHIPIVYL